MLLNSQAYQPYVGLELIEENFPTPEELLNPGLFARRRVERERRRRAAETTESTTESTPEPTPEPTQHLRLKLQSLLIIIAFQLILELLEVMVKKN